MRGQGQCSDTADGNKNLKITIQAKNVKWIDNLTFYSMDVNY